MKTLAYSRLPARLWVLYGLIFSTLVALFGIFLAPSTHALSGSDFIPGNIINDSIFHNSSSMSASDIQSFLNERVPQCDTNGTQSVSYYYNSSTKQVSFGSFSGGSYVTTTRAVYGDRYNEYKNRTDGDAPFICLRNYSVSTPSMAAETDLCNSYTGGTKSAAQLIYDVAQSCGINPQVLLVLLDKESSLVSDVWPQGIQYASATGYACPDNNPCNSAYAGLFKQIYYAARQFKLYEKNSNSYAYQAESTVSILYNPNTSCGSSSVYIQNQATANLYIYTPYQPNQAALDNLYGEGNSCSAYGNRNFWRVFNDWFGSTTDSLFFRVGTTDAVYAEGANNTYYHVPSQTKLKEFGYGTRYAFIKSVKSSYKSSRTSAGTLPATVRFVAGGPIYAMSNGSVAQFPSREVLETYGFNVGDEAFLDGDKWQTNYPVGPQVELILKQTDRNEVYSIEAGRKHHISNGTAYATLGSPTYNTRANVTLSSSFASNIPTGAPILIDGTIVKTASGYRIYSDNTTQAISAGILSETGIPATYESTDAVMDLITKIGSTIGKLVKDASDNRYIINRGNKVKAPDNISGTFVTASQDFLDRLTTFNTTDNLLFKINGGSKVYIVHNNKLYHVYSGADLAGLGHSQNEVFNATTATANLFTQTNASAFANGRLFRIAGESTVYVVDGLMKKRAIPTKDILVQHRFSMNSVVDVPHVTANRHSNLTALSYFTRDDSGAVWVLDSGKKFALTSDLATNHYQLSVGSLYELSNTKLDAISTNSQSMTRLVRAKLDSKIYLIEAGAKRWITTRQAFDNAGYSMSDVVELSKNFIDSIPTGSSI